MQRLCISALACLISVSVVRQGLKLYIETRKNNEKYSSLNFNDLCFWFCKGTKGLFC